VSIVFLETEEETHWCISQRGDTPSLPIRVVLFDYDKLGYDVQVNFSIGNSDGNRRLGCTVNSRDYVPNIPDKFEVETGKVIELAFIEGNPSIRLKMLYLAKNDVKVYRDGIWHIRKELQDSFPISKLLNYGRTGIIAGSLSKAG